MPCRVHSSAARVVGNVVGLAPMGHAIQAKYLFVSAKVEVLAIVAFMRSSTSNFPKVDIS